MEADLRIKLNCSRPELEGFQDYYEQKMYPTLLELEEQLEKTMSKVTRNAILALGLFIVFAIIYYVLGLNLHQENFNLLILIVLIYGFLAYIFATRPISKVKSEAKNFLMNEICSYLKINYNAKAENFPFNLFKNAGLLPGHDSKRLNDHLYGSYKGIDFNLAECSLTKTTRTGSGKDSHSFTENVYDGILVSLNYPHPFKGKTLISSDSGVFKNFFKGVFHGKKIDLGHFGLDNTYMIHTTDEEEARKLLSPQRVEKIMALVDHVGSKALELAFSNEQLLLSIKTDQLHTGTQSVHDAGAFTTAVTYYLEEVCLVFDLIDLLGLESKTA